MQAFAADTNESLLVATSVAALVGVLHTLAGPDHWLPFVEIAREQRTGTRRLVRLVLLCGALHCLSSVVLAMLGVALGEALTAFTELNEARGFLAGLALMVLGIFLLFPRGFVARGSRPRRTGFWMVLVFVLGPCEWLVPFAMAAAVRHGPAGLVAVASSFSFATVATMLCATLSAVGLLSPLFERVGERRARLLSAGLVIASGALVLCGF